MDFHYLLFKVLFVKSIDGLYDGMNIYIYIFKKQAVSSICASLCVFREVFPGVGGTAAGSSAARAGKDPPFLSRPF